jgi:D-3-phosphoglycerate dehydrogenase
LPKPIVLIVEELSSATVLPLGPDLEIKTIDFTNRAVLLAELATASAILVRSETQVDAEAIAAAKPLKVIARAGVGLDNVDVKAATSAGVMAKITEGSGSCLKAQKVVVGFSQ